MDTLLMELLTELFHRTAIASGYAIVVIALIILVQMLLRQRLSAGWMCALWLILLARLTLPTGPSSSLSLWNLLPQKAYEANEESSGADSGTIVQPVARLQKPDAGGPPMPPVQTRSISQILKKALPVIWIGGILIMLGGIIIKNLRLWLSVRNLRQATCQPLLEMLEDCKQLMRVRTIVGLVLTDRVQSPALFGFLRPRILLPEQLAGRIPPEELGCIFLHELAHQKRGDVWLGWLVAVLQALHWFNPLIWWAFARMRSDREAAADALALRRMHDGTSDRYAETIVNLLESFAQSPRLPVIAGIVESKTQIKRRLAMITGYKPPRRIEKVIAPALLAILAMAILTDAQDSAVPAQQQMLKQSGAVSFTPAYVFADKFRVSASEQASRLVYQTEPVYPENAKAVGIVGETEFEVTVDEGGNVIDIWSVKGHPLLANAAADAIQRWRYSSILLDNTPTSVSFPIIIAFLPDGTVTTSLVMTTQPLQNGFLNTPIPPAVIDDESPNSRILTAANTGFRTFKGRRYLLIGQGMSAAVVDIDKNKLRDLADVGWPVEYEPTDSGIAPMVFRVFINKAGGIDGIEQEYGPRIPAIDDLLLHTRVLSPAMFGTETVPSHLRFEISPPQSLIDKETQFVSPAFIRRPASPTDLRQR